VSYDVTEETVEDLAILYKPMVEDWLKEAGKPLSCEHPDDRVLAGSYTDQFLVHIWDRHPDDLEPLLERMIESDNEKVAEGGAFWLLRGEVGLNWDVLRRLDA
jgi:hypothetical protein